MEEIEKEAKEIVERFKDHTKIFDNKEGWIENEETAKQHALIALEMIIESNPTTVYDEKDFCNKMHYLNLIDVIREL